MAARRILLLIARTSLVVVAGCNAIVGTQDIAYVDPAPSSSGSSGGSSGNGPPKSGGSTEETPGDAGVDGASITDAEADEGVDGDGGISESDGGSGADV